MIVQSLEKALNRYLSLDPESARRLAAVEGKIITIQFAALKYSVQLQVLDQKLRLLLGEQHSAEVTIKGTPLSMLSLALSRDKKQHFLLTDLAIEGDAELAQQMMDIFERLEIDWEEYLSHGIGDVAAHELGRFTKSIIAWGKEAKEKLMRNTAEYIHEEKPWFPPEEAVQDFLREVDELRMDMDRLEAKVKGILTSEPQS